MYLSQLSFNPRHRQVQAEAANPYQLHRTLMGAFPDDLPGGERVLFRLETDNRGGLTCLIQSRTKPDFSALAKKDGYLLNLEGPKEFDLAPGTAQRLAFRLRANPVVSKWDGTPGKRGKRVGLLKEEDQLEWLKRKLATAGARVLEARIQKQGYQSSRKPNAKRPQTHLAVQFEGLLEVIDPETLAEAVRQGIGPAKGYGFGLLSLAKV